MEYIKSGGWGMYPVLLFGVVSMAFATLHAAMPRRRLLPVVVGLATATLLAGVLGAVIGIQRSGDAMPGVDPSKYWLFLLGMSESLNCVASALVMVMVDTLLVTVGATRIAMSGPDAARAAWVPES